MSELHVEQDQLHWPDSASPEIKDLVERLLCPEYPKRLGFPLSGGRLNRSQHGCEAIKKHPFFAGTSWEATKIGSFAVSSCVFVSPLRE